MADPFEVRMRFTSHLQHLSASTTSAQKTALYALKHAVFADDLHSVILETLERSSLNARANIMYFLPALCDAAQQQGDTNYVRMLQRDILRVVDLVAPDDDGGAGKANVRVVRAVLGMLQAKEVLQQETVDELEECIAARVEGGMLTPEPIEAAGALPAKTQAEDVAATGSGSGQRSTPQSNAVAGPRDGSGLTAVKLDKRQIEQRIEEDRERHKRAREGIWAVKQPQVTPVHGLGALAADVEFDKLWAEVLVGEAGLEEEILIAKEEAEGRKTCLQFEDVSASWR